MTKVVKYFFEAIFIYLFFIIAKILGLKLSRKLFSTIFRIVGPLIKSNRIIDKNLDIFSKNISTDNTNKIKKEMWENYGKTFIEYIFLKKLRNNQTVIVIEGSEILDKIYNINKPVIFFSGHFANFELMSMEITKRNIKLATIYRPLNNFFLNPLMEYLRRKYVCNNQIKKGRIGVKQAINFINKKHSIALMIDQRLSEGEKINLFGKPALTTTLPAQLSLKYKLDLVPVFIKRKEDDTFVMKVFDPIPHSSLSDKLNTSNKINKLLEKMIKDNPYQWIWTHNRWK